VKVGWIAKSVTEKNNRRVDCAEADKKTVQAQRNEGWGFLAAGDLPSYVCKAFEIFKKYIIFAFKPGRNVRE
jgi:hypothetical protein